MRTLASTIASTIVCVSSVCADDVEWINPAGGSWGNGTNWSGGAPPDGDDTALFNALTGPYAVTITIPRSVGRVAINSQNCTLTIAGSASDASLTAANYVVNRGAIELSSFAPGRNATLAVTNGTLVNEPDGEIRLLKGADSSVGVGGRYLDCEFDNRGTVNGDYEHQLEIKRDGANHINSGLMQRAAGFGGVYFRGTSFTNDGEIVSTGNCTFSVADTLNRGIITLTGSLDLGPGPPFPPCVVMNESGAMISATSLNFRGLYTNRGVTELMGGSLTASDQGFSIAPGGELRSIGGGFYQGRLSNNGVIKMTSGANGSALLYLIATSQAGDDGIFDFEVTSQWATRLRLGPITELTPRIRLTVPLEDVPTTGQQIELIVDDPPPIVEHLACADVLGLFFGDGLRFKLIRGPTASCPTCRGVTLEVVDVGLHVGDLNCDCITNLSDLTLMLANFGATDADPGNGDLNDDHAVSLEDLTILLSSFGTSCP